MTPPAELKGLSYIVLRNLVHVYIVYISYLRGQTWINTIENFCVVGETVFKFDKVV